MIKFRPWLLVGVVFAGLLTAYFFAFRAAREAQIKDVPLAIKGAKP